MSSSACDAVQVAFSSFTNIGPIMAIAIAVHNIPEVAQASVICHVVSSASDAASLYCHSADSYNALLLYSADDTALISGSHTSTASMCHLLSHEQWSSTHT